MRLPIRIVVAVAAIVVLGAGCFHDKYPHGPATYIVYIDGDCLPETVGGDPYAHLRLFPGDEVIIVNTRTGDITIGFTDSAVFGISTLDIPAGKRRKVTVLDGAVGEDTTFGVSGGCTPATGSGLGDPDVKVGECP